MTTRALALIALTIAVVGVACGPPPPPPPPPPADNPITLGDANALGDGAVGSAAVSADGSAVAFTSDATNMVPGDTNGVRDLFARDRTTGAVTRLAEGVGSDVTISSNGRYVGFRAGADLAVHDRQSGTTDQWSTLTDFGVRAPVVASDGSAAVYGAPSSFGAFATSCKVRDMATGVESDCPPGGPGFGSLSFEAVSPNARFVMYFWNDQSGGGTSGRFVWDRQLDVTTEVTQQVVAFPGTVSISDDGRYVATAGITTPITPALYDLQTGTTTPFPVAPAGEAIMPLEVSADGSTVLVVADSAALVPGDTNGAADLFLWTPDTGDVERISVTDPGGAELASGATSCGPPPGRILADGSAACVLASDAVVATDTNGVVDAHLLP